MTKYKKIIAIKTGWCETYNGDKPKGNHGYLKDGNVGHEIFNFRKFENKYYGYIPPKASIEDDDEHGWLIAMFALQEGTGKLCLVGWYENATISSETSVRPEYLKDKGFPKDSFNDKFVYHFKSSRATLLPVNDRNFLPNQVLSIPRLKSAKVVYLRGHNQTQRAIKNGHAESEWREQLSKEIEKYIHNYKPDTEEDNKLIPPGSKSDHNIVPPDEKNKKLIENSAIDQARIMLKKEGFNIINSRESERGIGYDLQAICRKKGKEYKEWHVEVKGTSLDRGRFFMTKNEYDAAECDSKKYAADHNNAEWRLILVENALEEKPRVRCFKWKEAKRLFKLEPICWYAEEK